MHCITYSITALLFVGIGARRHLTFQTSIHKTEIELISTDLEWQREMVVSSKALSQMAILADL